MAEKMQCMEVWGGNYGVDRHFHMPGLDVWVYADPHEDDPAGGDLYYLSSCASGRITRLLLADVSGHGVEVADCAVQLRNLMRRYVNRISQSRLVDGLNKEFTRITDSGKFATAVVGTFFAGNRRFQLCQAGHPPPLVYRQSTGKWEYCESAPELAKPGAVQNTPFGIIDSVEYVQLEFPFATGDMFLAYTDGLIEARDSQDRLLKRDGLLQIVRELDVSDPSTLLTALRSRLRERGIDSVDDDLTMLLARADGSGVDWKDNVMAPLRLLRRARDATKMREPREQPAST